MTKRVVKSYDEYTITGKVLAILVPIIIVLLVIGGLMFALPKYNVWKKELKGEAKLKEAKYSKKVMIEEAKANLEAEKLNAKAEVERAKGMAESMAIENGKLSEKYIKYLWVKNMKGNQNIIYVPTEGGIPMLEAGRSVK